ncbi:MAG: MFS transporter [Gammaproteobacteria bacterium]
MPGTLRSVRSLLLSVAILLTGHGLQLTLLPLKAYELGWDSSAIGLTGSAYYVGFIIGCLMIPGIIRRVGHIRAFAVMVATASMVVLAASVLESYAVWLALRLFTGWSMASLYTVIESWLNDRADNTRRGAVLGVYTMISLVALTLGQLFIELERLTLDELFPIAGLLIIGATIPVALTSRTQPGVPAAFEFNWRTVYDASHVGVVSAGISGLAMGLIWSVGAVYAAEVTGQVGRIAAAVPARAGLRPPRPALDHPRPRRAGRRRLERLDL